MPMPDYREALPLQLLSVPDIGGTDQWHQDDLHPADQPGPMADYL